jgi:dolichyl-phosphate-mannose--protein O-mannosyl transferase
VDGRHSDEVDAIVHDAPAPEPPVYPRGSVFDDWWGSRPGWVHTAARWAAPTAVVGVAAATRLIGLGHPAEIVFDETYYVKDAWSLWNLGYESNWPEDANERFAAGETQIFTGDASFVVHPPLGKWLIALGMAALGPANPVGWRIAMAVLGILAVILVMVVAKRLTGSRALAVIAGGLLAIDGNAIVMSRIGILDNALMFFVLVGFVCVVMDRQWAQRRLDAWLLHRDRTARDPGWGPALWWRPWLIAAGAALGAATAVKWSGLWFLAAFGLLTVASDLLMRRASGVEAWVTGTLLKQAPVSALLMVPIAAVVHLLAWLGWFRSENGYHRQWAEGDGNAWTGLLAWVPRDLQSWWHFQVVSYEYHVGESRDHSYESDAWMWPLSIRPTSFWFDGDASGCGGEGDCWAQITDLPNPLIWWAAAAALVFLAVVVVRSGRWPAMFVVVAYLAGWAPWLIYPERTMFQFYAIAIAPYAVIALAMAMGALVGSPADERSRRTSALVTVGVFLVVAAALSVFFWPVWTGQSIPSWEMALRWWLPSWR